MGGQSVRDVLGDAAGEEVGDLRYERELRAEVGDVGGED